MVITLIRIFCLVKVTRQMNFSSFSKVESCFTLISLTSLISKAKSKKTNALTYLLPCLALDPTLVIPTSCTKRLDTDLKPPFVKMNAKCTSLTTIVCWNRLKNFLSIKTKWKELRLKRQIIIIYLWMK